METITLEPGQTQLTSRQIDALVISMRTKVRRDLETLPSIRAGDKVSVTYEVTFYPPPAPNEGEP